MVATVNKCWHRGRQVSLQKLPGKCERQRCSEVGVQLLVAQTDFNLCRKNDSVLSCAVSHVREKNEDESTT